MKRNRTQFIEALESRRLLATFTVTNLLDNGAGSLRVALNNATSGDTINFANGVSGTITLGSPMTITQDVNIQGPGEGSLTIDGNGSVRAFVIHSATLTMSGLTLTNCDGHADSNGGGAIWVDSHSAVNLTDVAINLCTADTGGALSIQTSGSTLTDCSLMTNTATEGGGGAISCQGSLTIDSSTIAGNIANGPVQDDGMGDIMGGRGEGGGLELSSGTVSITNTTIANNTASADAGQMGQSIARGGGLVWDNNGSLTMLNCTISGNVCSAQNAAGGGIDIDFNGNQTFTNCLIAGNFASTEPDFAAGSGSVVSDGHNIVGQITDFSHITAANGVSGDQIGTSANPIDPKLGALANNGGPTETMALLAGSPAIDAASNSAAPSTDQRGESRYGTADVGAFERQGNHAPVFATTSLGMATAGLPFSATVSATDADGDSLSFSAASKPDWITVTDNGNGTATVSGTPTYLNGGTNSVGVTVGDGITSVSQTFNFGVAVPPVVLDGNALLSAYGTVADDTLQVWVRNGSTVRVSSNGVLRNYPLASVHSVQVYGMAGNDSVTLNLKTIPGYVFGGDGNDTITGGDEADTLSGAAGNDVINGGGGNDRVNGDGGKDILDGGEGHDRLFGGDGHDVLDARDGMTDTLDGGGGANDAIYDVGLDVVRNV